MNDRHSDLKSENLRNLRFEIGEQNSAYRPAFDCMAFVFKFSLSDSQIRDPLVLAEAEARPAVSVSQAMLSKSEEEAY
jgi:hypothetical protein